MMILPERALEWVQRWSQHGLSLGRHDGTGQPIFEYEPDDAVAADMVAELKADGVLAHGVVVIIVEMVRRAAAEDGLEP